MNSWEFQKNMKMENVDLDLHITCMCVGDRDISMIYEWEDPDLCGWSTEAAGFNSFGLK
jgi:hypothetical protein